jgi:hypothetical protein
LNVLNKENRNNLILYILDYLNKEKENINNLLINIIDLEIYRFQLKEIKGIYEYSIEYKILIEDLLKCLQDIIEYINISESESKIENKVIIEDL